jgi:hypothetical protein
VVDVPVTVHGVTIKDGYSKAISLASPLTLDGVDSKGAPVRTSGLELNSPTATIVGSA